jgi:glycosyltransferase involved in cell wall biosynthesis
VCVFKPDVSVLVPVRDEADSLEALCAGIVAALDHDVAARSAARSWEVIFIDDGSDDGSWEVMEKLAERDKRVRGLRLRRNFGKSAALAAGLKESQGSIVVTIDGDLQDDPAEIPGMLARLDDSVDMVAGYKAERQDPLSRRLASKVFNRVTGSVTGLKLRDHNCGLKAAKREVFENVPLYGEMHRYLAAIGHARGFRVVEQAVHHRPRKHGRSKFGVERYARAGIDLLTVVMLTRYSRRPAHLFGGMGLLAGIVGFGILVYLTGVWTFTDQPIGTRPLLLLGVLLVLLAVQLASLGLVAELLVNQQATKDNQDPQRHVIARTDS